MAVAGGAVVGAGDAAGTTPTAVDADEGPYESVPRKSAMIVYSPAAGGAHSLWNTPFWSLVTVPRSMVLWLASTAVK